MARASEPSKMAPPWRGDEEAPDCPTAAEADHGGAEDRLARPQGQESNPRRRGFSPPLAILATLRPRPYQRTVRAHGHLRGPLDER